MKIESKYDWLYDIFTESFCATIDCNECPFYRDCQSVEVNSCIETWKKYLKRKLEQ